MALTVSHIEADFVKDTKTLGKQTAYLEFHFGDRHHATDEHKSAGKFASWDTPVQLTGAGVTMKIIAKASKSLAKDKPLGVGELNLVNAAGKGMQVVPLHDVTTHEPAGEVRLQITGGSPAISGLPHTEGHGLGSSSGGMMSGHQGQGHEGHHHGAETAAGVGAAGVGAKALHHHQNENQGLNQGTTGQQYGSTTGSGTGLGGQQYGSSTGTSTGLGGQQYGQSGTGGIGGSSVPPPSGVSGQQYGQTGTTGGMGQGSSGIGSSTSAGAGGIGGGHSHADGATCPHCSGTGSVAQRLEQGLHLGGGQQGTY